MKQQHVSKTSREVIEPLIAAIKAQELLAADHPCGFCAIPAVAEKGRLLWSQQLIRLGM